MSKKIRRCYDMHPEIVERYERIYDYCRIKLGKKKSKNQFIEDICIVYLTKYKNLEAKAIKWAEPEK